MERNTIMSKVIVRSIKQHSIANVVREIFNGLNWLKIIKPDAKVVIKLNLNTPEPKKVASANTSPQLVQAVCEVLLERTSHIALVEAHSYRYSAELAFKNTGIYSIGEKLGVRVVNLSTEPCRDVGHELLGPIPEILLDADLIQRGIDLREGVHVLQAHLEVRQVP